MPPPSLTLSYDPSGPTFPITEQCEMPNIKVTANLKDITPDPKLPLQYRWAVSLLFTGAKCVHSLNRNIKHPDISCVTAVNALAIPFTKVRGGDLTISVAVRVGNVELTAKSAGLQVTGTNPGMGALMAATPDNDAFKKLMRVESRLKQFLGPTCPYFSEDDYGGVGICQITNPSPSEDQVWSWKENLKAGWQFYKDKQSVARRYPADVRNSTEFKALVKAYNDKRLAQNKAAAAPGGIRPPDVKGPAVGATVPELKALIVDLPDYTEEQLQRDTIRGYNGYATGWHEYRVKTDKDGLLVVTVSADGTKGTAEWEQITAEQRKAHYKDVQLSEKKWGNPNYVEEVEAEASF
jgi:hypothetical protein